jgi:hypothetical protein
MAIKNNEYLEFAQKLIDDYLARTGIVNDQGHPEQRYLWTDAFAVQTCFALAHALDREVYHEFARTLIEKVHYNLGRHRPDDPREGWISGLPIEEGKMNPTAGGLRIGKRLRERQAGEPLIQSVEWERNGQYFHYLTRWFNALMQAFVETGQKEYAMWAAELIEVGEKYVTKDNGRIRMYYKMSVDLSVPVMKSMGAHDPLEGLLCVLAVSVAVPEKTAGLETLERDLRMLCQGMNWSTADALGIGGLLLNTARSAELAMSGKEMPENIQPEQLFTESLASLQAFSKQVYNPLMPAEGRLAFRECGLTLGIRVLYGLRKRYGELVMELDALKNFVPLADEIESFWIHPMNRKSPTWVDHLDINAVTLASSLAARVYPHAFCAVTGI